MNKHIDHIETAVLKDPGPFKDYHFTLDGRVSVKFDGAPAVCFGKTQGGEVFVATKSLFNKSPKFFTRAAEIARAEENNPQQSNVFFALFTLLAQIKLNAGFLKDGQVFQGDLMWCETSNIPIKDINGWAKSKANVLTYTYEKKPGAKIGIAVHTEYTIDEDLVVAEVPERLNFDLFKNHYFGESIQFILPELSVWDSVELNEALSAYVEIIHRLASNLEKTADLPGYEKFCEYVDVFINSGLRGGNTSFFNLRCFQDWLQRFMGDKIAAFKSTKAKLKWAAIHRDIVMVCSSFGWDPIITIESLQQAKLDILNFINVEGIAAVSVVNECGPIYGEGRATHEGLVFKDGETRYKIVDRTGFSALNFDPNFTKGWQA